MVYEVVSNVSMKSLEIGIFGFWLKSPNGREYRMLVTRHTDCGAPYLVSGLHTFSVKETLLFLIPAANDKDPVCGFLEFQDEWDLFSWISDGDNLFLCELPDFGKV